MRDRVAALADRSAELPGGGVMRLTLPGGGVMRLMLASLTEELLPDAGGSPDDWVAKIELAELHAHDARAVGVMQLIVEPRADSLAEPNIEAVYRLRFEDRTGRCSDVLLRVRIAEAGRVAWGERTGTPCIPWMMAETIERARRIARLPLSAGALGDNWSAALAARGEVDVYLDSVVVRAATVQLRIKPQDGAPVRVDSISVGLALGHGTGWSVARHSRPFPVGRTFKTGEDWSKRDLRFTIPLDEGFEVQRAWPVFEVVLGVPKTKDNPYGYAWSYAHEKQGFFESLKPAPDR